jgi:hypothetical protein
LKIHQIRCRRQAASFSIIFFARKVSMIVRNWPEPARQGGGQTTAALPGTSDVDFLGDLKRVVDLSGPSRGPGSFFQ